MACRPLKSVNFNGFTKPADVLKSLEDELKSLAEICLDTDFADASQMALFERNVLFIKGYYERYERLLRDSMKEETSE